MMSGGSQAVEIENAVLKAENASLREQVDGLKKALRELVQVLHL